jgi:transaldolase
MTRLHDLSKNEQQSPWVDNLRRDWLQGGQLAALVDGGVRGVTSNPTIFAKAIEGQDTYDEQFRELVGSCSVEDAYWELVVRDIQDGLAVLRPVHDDSGGGDGFVSLEVSPRLAHDRTGTIASARALHARIAQPNLLVKVPATEEGVEAIQTLIGEGHSINVTLIFGLERYAAVMEAYIAGLEALLASGTETLGHVNSVASFFVSRVDSEVDRRLGKLPGVPPELFGQAAVAQAKVAFENFRATFCGPRWEALAARGARVQRPLWASTSTKNPAYPDLLYVDSLIGPDTVNTMPEATLEAFNDHGTVARTVDEDVSGAQGTIARLSDVGIDLAAVATTLEDEGVASFTKSFEDLLEILEKKAAMWTKGQTA